MMLIVLDFLGRVAFACGGARCCRRPGIRLVGALLEAHFQLHKARAPVQAYSSLDSFLMLPVCCRTVRGNRARSPFGSYEATAFSPHLPHPASLALRSVREHQLPLRARGRANRPTLIGSCWKPRLGRAG